MKKVFRVHYGSTGSYTGRIRKPKIQWFETYRDVMIEFYFQRIVHNRSCWYNPSQDPGIKCNDGSTEKNLEKCNENSKWLISGVHQKINDHISKVETETIDDSALRLIKWATIASAELDSNYLRKQLENSIEDLELWIDNLDEQSSMYQSYTDHKGRP